MKHELAAVALVLALMSSGIAAYAVFKPVPVPSVNVQVPQQDQTYGAVNGPESSNSYYCVNGLCRWNAPISCNTASTTAFGVKNPFNATSTAELVAFYGIGNATTTTLQIGTSTAPTGAASTVYGILFNGSVATSAPFVISSGIRNGPTNSFIDAGSASVTKIVVRPTESVVGFATTTATGSGAASFTAGYTSCAGYIQFTRLK